MILSNGRIYTIDARDRIVDTLVVRDGRVAFAGRRRDVNPTPGEPEIDLGGRAVLPGLIDAHGHLMHLARLRLTLDVARLPSEAACAERVAARAANVSKGQWIAGRGWDQNRWPGALFPARVPRPRRARSSGLAGSDRRARDLGQFRGAPGRRHRSAYTGSPGRPPRA